MASARQHPGQAETWAAWRDTGDAGGGVSARRLPHLFGAVNDFVFIGGLIFLVIAVVLVIYG